jgi:archaellum biogenesis ATPase FlaH
MNIETVNYGIAEKRIIQLLDSKSILMFGPRSSGKTITCINYSLYGLNSSKCLYFSSSSKQNLIETIYTLYPESKKIINKDLIIYEAPELNSKKDDAAYAKIILGTLDLVNQMKPERIVFDEITPYLGFSDMHYLKTVFIQLLENLKNINVKFLFTAAEPASPRAESVIKILREEFSYFINLSNNPVVNR